MKNSFNMSLIFMIFMSFSVTAMAEKPDSPLTIDGTKKVTAEEVIDLVTNLPDIVIVDARKASDRDGAGWIEGSIGLPNTSTNEESLAKHVASKDTPVLFYCNGIKCGRSVESSKLAVSLGYKKIYWFRGGWEEWTTKGMPISQ